jgi:hypothetical protein
VELIFTFKKKEKHHGVSFFQNQAEKECKQRINKIEMVRHVNVQNHNLPPAKKVNGHDECGSAARAARVRDVGGLRVGPETLLVHELSSCS